MDPKLSLPNKWLVTCHTDYVGPGSTFVAIKGYQIDGVQFIAKAIAQGACKIVVAHDAPLSAEQLEQMVTQKIELMRVVDTRKALAELSAQAYRFPAERLHILAITGTKGKTTTAYLLHHMLRQAGYNTALLSTVENKIGAAACKAPLTTAQPDYLHMFFDQCVQQNVSHVVMEVAAQAFSLSRVVDITFAGGIFTNFSHEHGEFYVTMYVDFAAKCGLLAQL